MKVLIINSVCGRQSTGRIATGIQDVLISNGHKCIIAYGEKNSIVKKTDYRIGNEIDRYFHALSTRVFDNTGFCSKRVTKKFVKFIESYNPDVIHIHNLHGYYINIKILFEFLKKYNRPIIWTLHDCWAFTGHSAYCDAIGCNKWIDGCNKCAQVKDYPKSFRDRSKKNWLEKKCLYASGLNMMIVTPSYWLADLVKKSFLNKYPIKVIHNGIDLNIFKALKSNIKDEYNIKDKKIILGVAAVWDRRKGLNDFLKLSKLIDDSWRIVLIGISKDQKKNLPPNILGLYKTDSTKQLAEWYSTADVFVNPTYEDNYPTVNMEAISCGTPVITYNTGGSPESLDANTGIIVKKGNVEEIFKAICNLKSSFEFKANREKHDSHLSIDKYIDLFNEIL